MKARESAEPSFPTRVGELPLEHGAFRWDGEIPETAPTGPASVTMRVLEGTEVRVVDHQKLSHCD